MPMGGVRPNLLALVEGATTSSPRGPLTLELKPRPIPWVMPLWLPICPGGEIPALLHIMVSLVKRVLAVI